MIKSYHVDRAANGDDPFRYGRGRPRGCRGGDYVSTSEIVREALRDWRMKKELRLQELASLKADIAQGLAALAAGRVDAFDPARIIERGKRLLASRSRSG
jgi:antitoxin ParD1/3/4